MLRVVAEIDDVKHTLELSSVHKYNVNGKDLFRAVLSTVASFGVDITFDDVLEEFGMEDEEVEDEV